MKINKVMIAISLLLISCVFVAWAATFYLKNTGHQLDFSCSGHFQQREESGGYSMDVSYAIDFVPDGTAMVTMTGNVSESGKYYNMSRITTFDYALHSNNIYRISSINVRPSRRENLPQNIFEKYFYSTNEKGNFITITKVSGIDNAWLIGSNMSPAFMCIKS